MNPIEQEKRSAGTGLNAESIKELWTKTYNTQGKPDWSHILPFYDENIYFRDSVQELRGIEEFVAMTRRLTDRSKDLSMNIVRTAQHEKDVFIDCFSFIGSSCNLIGSGFQTYLNNFRLCSQPDGGSPKAQTG